MIHVNSSSRKIQQQQAAGETRNEAGSVIQFRHQCFEVETAHFSLLMSTTLFPIEDRDNDLRSSQMGTQTILVVDNKLLPA